LRLRWILGLIVLTLALALAACGGGDEEENGGGEKETPAATKTVEAEGTPEVVETSKPEKTEEPSGGGGASLGDVPVYPGADKVADYSGSDVPLPLLAGDLDVEEYGDSKWAVYETGDSVDDVADFYKGQMPDKGWEEEGWFDTSLGDGVAWGSYTRDDGDTAAWVAISGTDDQTQIVIGTGSR
jgi:hypothetical protein